jgi:hypothetical protein
MNCGVQYMHCWALSQTTHRFQQAIEQARTVAADGANGRTEVLKGIKASMLRGARRCHSSKGRCLRLCCHLPSVWLQESVATTFLDQCNLQLKKAFPFWCRQRLPTREFRVAVRRLLPYHATISCLAPPCRTVPHCCSRPPRHVECEVSQNPLNACPHCSSKVSIPHSVSV